jgi:NodT family efflux transporter outer membrane factor (OMF) lipoprotein
MNLSLRPSRRPRARAALATLALVLDAGCVVGPDYHAPEQTLEMKTWSAPAATPATPSVGATETVTGEPVVDAWWTTFSDPLIPRLVDRALASSPEIEIAVQRVREARAGLRFVAGRAMPRVGASASRTEFRRAGPLNTIYPGNYPTYQAGFDAGWELDLFGGTRRAVEAAGATIDATVETGRGVRLTLAAEVVRHYINLRAAQRRLVIAQTNLAAQERSLELTREKLRAGVVSELDTLRAAALVANTRAALPALENQAATSVHRLGVLLGEEPSALARELAAPRPIPTPPARVAIGLPAELLRRRPDVRAAERRLAAATARIGVAQAELYPHLGLAGSIGFVSTATGNLFDYSNRYFSLGPGLRWNLFDGGRVRAQVEAESARAARALADYRRIVLSALAEADNALGAFDSEQRRHAGLAAAVDSGRRAVATAGSLYREGVTDFLSVLDAQRSLAAAEDTLAQSDRAISLDLVALFKALGGGADSFAPAPPSAHASSNRTGKPTLPL